MPIALIINTLGFGGAERVFVDDANMFAAGGYRVTFFLLYRGELQSHPLAAELDPRVRIVLLRAKGPFDIGAVARCARELTNNSIGVLLSTLNDSNMFARLVTVRIGRKRLHLVQREANTVSQKTWWQRVFDALSGWVPLRTIAVSSEVYDSLARRSRNVILLQNGIPISPVFLTKKQTNEGPLRLVTVGRLVPQKDHRTLLLALGLLARSGTDFEAALIGQGPLRSELEKLARDEGIADRVKFLGVLPHERVLESLAASDVFCLSSRWEGSPNVLLEAMAAGLAIAATEVGGVSDLIGNDREGLLVLAGNVDALYQALKKLSADPGLREKLGRAARTRVESTFSREARFDRLRGIVGLK